MSPLKLQTLLESAVVHHREGRLAEAEESYRQVRAEAPKNFDALHLSGLVAYQQSRLPEAIELLGRALRIDPRSVVCEMRYALALLAANRAVEAENHLRHAVKVKSDFVDGWENLAYCLKTQDRLLEALTCHEKVTGLKPTYAIGWYNEGLTLSMLGRYREAQRCHESALEADANCALAHFGRAQALHQQHRMKEAVEEYEKFLKLEPTHAEALSYRLFALHTLEGVSRDQLFAEHLEYGRVIGNPPPPALTNSIDPTRRLRVAILSPDLRAHSCAYFLEPLLRHLSRSQFELYLYHDHFREDAVSMRLRQLAKVWRNFVGQTGAAVERMIRADAPDVLIDLAGHTGMTSRLPLFARRLAPVQITYLGYPNTTGLPAMDFRFTDAIADPPGDSEAFATEKLVRFAPTAWSYDPPADAPEPNGPPCLANGIITFGCFNTPAKVTDAMLALWARILKAAPVARLRLKGAGFGDASTRQRYADRFAHFGVASSRVDLLDRTADTKSHLAHYHDIDIALDTFPYNGTTTTCEALWMGIPVVSLTGESHMSRVGASLLHAVGHPEWSATSEEDYLRVATELIDDPAKLIGLRAGLRGDLKRSPLLDHAGQAERFGAAIRTCWIEWCERSVEAVQA